MRIYFRYVDIYYLPIYIFPGKFNNTSSLKRGFVELCVSPLIGSLKTSKNFKIR